MKYFITIFFAFLSLAAEAQISELTESDKQEALQKATQFCNLFSRWCNGERTLDTQIYNLCSGADCSAYDEVVSQKETSMRKYINGIQHKYPKLECQITAPSLSQSHITYEPIPNWTESIKIGNMPYQTTQTEKLDIDFYSNAYIIFDVTISLPSLNKSLTKKVIYDYNANQITGFITGQGTLLSYINGLECISNEQYKEAIHHFDISASNNRASLKLISNWLAFICSAHLQDIPLMYKYAHATDDKFLKVYVDVIDKEKKQQYNSALPPLKECYRIASEDSNYAVYLPSINLQLGLIYGMLPSEGNLHYDPNLSVEHIKKAIEGGNVQAAYVLIRMCLTRGKNDFESYVTDEEFANYIEWAASKGHPDCIFIIGSKAESVGYFSKAKDWYSIGAKSGHELLMAKLGKLLVEQGGSYVAEGKSWLRKALESDKLEKYINMYKQDGINENFWPQSVDDVMRLLNENASQSSSTSSSTYQPSTSSSSNSNSTSSNNSSNTVTSSSSYTSSYSSHSHYKRYHGPFNKKKDSYWGGLSFGYIQKQWVFEEDGVKEKCGLFDDAKYNNGIQVGLRVDPQFGAGFGMNSGLFYEYCWDKSKEEYDRYGSYHYTYEEHGIYMPVNLKFTMNFSKWFQLSFYGGVGLNYVFAGNLYMRDDGETFSSEDIFSEEDDFSRFNLMAEYGASLRVGSIQFDFNVSKGLTDWSDTDGLKITQSRPLNLSMTFCF